MTSFDLDIDALLAAETDEEDDNLPDLERSLEDILDDAWEEEERTALGLQIDSQSRHEENEASEEMVLNVEQIESTHIPKQKHFLPVESPESGEDESIRVTGSGSHSSNNVLPMHWDPKAGLTEKMEITGQRERPETGELDMPRNVVNITAAAKGKGKSSFWENTTAGRLLKNTRIVSQFWQGNSSLSSLDGASTSSAPLPPSSKLDVQEVGRSEEENKQGGNGGGSSPVWGSPRSIASSIESGNSFFSVGRISTNSVPASLTSQASKGLSTRSNRGGLRPGAAFAAAEAFAAMAAQRRAAAIIGPSMTNDIVNSVHVGTRRNSSSGLVSTLGDVYQGEGQTALEEKMEPIKPVPVQEFSGTNPGSHRRECLSDEDIEQRIFEAPANMSCPESPAVFLEGGLTEKDNGQGHAGDSLQPDDHQNDGTQFSPAPSSPSNSMLDSTAVCTYVNSEQEDLKASSASQQPQRYSRVFTMPEDMENTENIEPPKKAVTLTQSEVQVCPAGGTNVGSTEYTRPESEDRQSIGSEVANEVGQSVIEKQAEERTMTTEIEEISSITEVDDDDNWIDLEGLDSLLAVDLHDANMVDAVEHQIQQKSPTEDVPIFGGKSQREQKRQREQDSYQDEMVGSQGKRRFDAKRLEALEHAVELERRKASSGLTWEEGAVAQPMRLEGIQRGPPAIGLLQLDNVGSLSAALANPAMKRDHGVPLALAVHSNFIAVGLSKGGILVAPSRYSPNRSADNTEDKAFLLGGTAASSTGSAETLDFNQQGDLLLAGYSSGAITLWDIVRGTVAKAIVGEHSQPVVHARFIGQDQQSSRSPRALTADSRGAVLLHTFTVLPLLRRFTVTTQCLLDGSRGGPVLAIAPVLTEEGFAPLGTATTSTAGSMATTGGLSGVMGGVGGVMDAGKKLLEGTSQDEYSGAVALITGSMALLVRLAPSLEVLARFERPTRSGHLAAPSDGSIPYAAWRRIRTRSSSTIQHASSLPTTLPPSSSKGSIAIDGLGNRGQGDVRADGAAEGIPGRGNSSFLDRASSGGLLSGWKTGSKDGPIVKQISDADLGGMLPKSNLQAGVLSKNLGVEEFSEEDKILALAWDRRVQVLQLLKGDVKVVYEWQLDSPACGVSWVADQMLAVLNAKDQLCLFTIDGSAIEQLGLEMGEESLICHTHFMDGPKVYHNAIAVRGAAIYCLGPSLLRRARLLPWRERIKALQDAGDWMGAFRIAMDLYDGRAEGVTGLPRGLEAMRAAIMPALLELLSAYIDEAFAYVHLALGFSTGHPPVVNHTMNGSAGVDRTVNGTSSTCSDSPGSHVNGSKPHSTQNGLVEDVKSGDDSNKDINKGGSVGSFRNGFGGKEGGKDKESGTKEEKAREHLSGPMTNGISSSAEGASVIATREQYARVGGVAVEFCVHLNQTTVLFDDVFRKFDAVGQRGIFLELLEPYILKDMLPGLAPECLVFFVRGCNFLKRLGCKGMLDLIIAAFFSLEPQQIMQALVEHYSTRNWLQRVEHCVLHMDIASLDFNQVVHLCRDHGLYSALIYLFTRGLDDFVSPLEELLAVVRDPRSSHGQEVGYKLLVYLQHCFAGLQFPPGHGRLPADKVAFIRNKLLSYILERTGRPRFAGPKGAFPRLRCLLALDTAASLAVLSTAFQKDESSGTGDNIYEKLGNGVEHGTVPAKEVNKVDNGSTGKTDELCIEGPDNKGAGDSLHALLVNAIVEIYETSVILSDPTETCQINQEKLPYRNGNHVDQTLSDLDTRAGLAMVSKEDAALLLEFIGQHSAAGHAAVSPTMFVRILEFLAEGEVERQPDCSGEGEERELGGDGTGDEQTVYTRSEKSQFVEKLQREGLMLALLEGASENTWDYAKVVQLARKAKFWQVSALLHTKRGFAYLPSALDCLLRDKELPQEPFSFVRRMLADGSSLQSDETALEAFRLAVLQRLPDLIHLNSEAALDLIQKHFSADIEHILKELSPRPELQFSLLKAIHQGALERRTVLSTTVESSGENFPLSTQSGLVPQSGGLRALGSQKLEAGLETGFKSTIRTTVGTESGRLMDSQKFTGLELTATMAEFYIELLCRFEPNSVLPFLQGHEQYRLEHCLSLCHHYGVTDAEAFLLERMGKVADALVLVLANLESKIQSMDLAIASQLMRKDSAKGQMTLDGQAEQQLIQPPQVAEVKEMVGVSVTFCQRNTQQLQQKEAEALWFQLIDRLVSPLREVKQATAFRKVKVRERARRKEETGNSEDTTCRSAKNDLRENMWQSSRSRRTADLMRTILVELMVAVMDGMSGYVPLPVVLSQLVEQNVQDECGDFRGLLLSLLGGLTFECSVLGTVKRLIEADMFDKVEKLRKGKAAGLAARGNSCSVCGENFTSEDWTKGISTEGRTVDGRENNSVGIVRNDSSVGSPFGVQIWSCGHMSHRTCREGTETNKVEGESSRYCPLCQQMDLKGRAGGEHLSKGSSPHFGLESQVVGGDGHRDFEEQDQKQLKEDQLLKGKSALAQLSLLSNLERARGARQARFELKMPLAPPRGPSRAQMVLQKSTKTLR